MSVVSRKVPKVLKRLRDMLIDSSQQMSVYPTGMVCVNGDGGTATERISILELDEVIDFLSGLSTRGSKSSVFSINWSGVSWFVIQAPLTDGSYVSAGLRNTGPPQFEELIERSGFSQTISEKLANIMNIRANVIVVSSDRLMRMDWLYCLAGTLPDRCTFLVGAPKRFNHDFQPWSNINIKHLRAFYRSFDEPLSHPLMEHIHHSDHTFLFEYNDSIDLFLAFGGRPYSLGRVIGVCGRSAEEGVERVLAGIRNWPFWHGKKEHIYLPGLFDYVLFLENRASDFSSKLIKLVWSKRDYRFEVVVEDDQMLFRKPEASTESGQELDIQSGMSDDGVVFSSEEAEDFLSSQEYETIDSIDQMDQVEEPQSDSLKEMENFETQTSLEKNSDASVGDFGHSNRKTPVSPWRSRLSNIQVDNKSPHTRNRPGVVRGYSLKTERFSAGRKVGPVSAKSEESRAELELNNKLSDQTPDGVDGIWDRINKKDGDE